MYICHRVVYALFCYTCFIIISYSSWHSFVFISLSYNACRTSFHLHAEPHLFWVSPALPGWACALQFIKTAFTPVLVYLLTFYCRCTLPGNAIFFIAHSLFNCHSSFCYMMPFIVSLFIRKWHFSSLKQRYGLHLCLYIYWYSTVVVLFQNRN